MVFKKSAACKDSADDEAKAEDIIDVSADNLEQLKKDSKQVDVDTLMRYIRVLSELAVG